MKPLLRPLVSLAFALFAALGSAGPARADDRYFPFSYPYNTPSRGERELELYTDVDASGLENQFEFEYGLTNHWMLSVYALAHNLSQYDGWKVESRYRVAEKNVLPLDLCLYLEASNTVADGPSLEGKLLFEKSLGAWIVDANLIAERHFVAEANEFNATLGVGYQFDPTVIGGGEAYYNANKLFVGPTLAVFLDSFHVTGGLYYGGANEALGRVVASQEF